MKTTNYKTQTRELHVTGQLWSGARCQYVYSLSGEIPQSRTQAHNIAGDFQGLDKVSIVITNREIRETTDRIKL